MKKSLVSVLTLLLVAVMLFAGVTPVVANAKEFAAMPVAEPALQSPISIPDSVKETDWIQMTLEGDEIVVILNPNLGVLKDFDEEEVEALLKKILDYAKESALSAWQNKGVLKDHLMDIVFAIYQDYKGHGSLTEMLQDPDLPEEIVACAYLVLEALEAADIIDRETVKYYAKYMVDKIEGYVEVLKDKAEGKFDDVFTEIVNRFGDFDFENIEDMFTYAKDLLDEAKATLKTYTGKDYTYSQIINLLKKGTDAAYAEIKADVVSYVKADIKALLADLTAESDLESVVATLNEKYGINVKEDDLLGFIATGATVDSFLDEFKLDELAEKEFKNFPTVDAKTMKAFGAMVLVLDKLDISVDKLLTSSNPMGVVKSGVVSFVKNIGRDDLIRYASKLLGAVEGVSINGYELYNGSTLNLTGIKNLILSIPGFGQISADAARTDPTGQIGNGIAEKFQFFS